MVQKTTNPQMTDQPDKYLRMSGEDAKFLDENNTFQVKNSYAQRIIDTAMFKHENTVMQLSDRIIRNTTETLVKTVTKEARRVTLSTIYGAMEDAFKQNVNRRTADIAFS